MNRLLFLALCLTGAAAAVHARADERTRWQSEARNTKIVRDNWGIAHVYGKSDADAVFGSLYAQAEDDFSRIERNYLTGLGCLAESEGEAAVDSDLRQRLFVRPDHLKQLYRGAPAWLQGLMVAWADGLNFYLSKHSDIRPKVIHHFEPWMALSFTEGSIGGDIETVDLAKLHDFYGGTAPGGVAYASAASTEPSPGGSNGFAIAPSRSASGHALLWINPHTSFYFRSELQMVSGQGLNAYGAVTWGQFFVYQGFNSRNGWMHTSYGGDAVDEYAETIVKKGGSFFYSYGAGLRKLRISQVRIRYKQGGGQAVREFTVYHSHHGPIVRTDHGKWIAVKLLQDPVRALAQSYARTKTTDYRSFRAIQDMRTDTSNNTVYADADGTIAYFHTPSRSAKSWSRMARPGAPTSPFSLHFDAQEVGADALGHIAENRHIRAALYDAVARAPNLELIAPRRFAIPACDAGTAAVTLNDGSRIAAVAGDRRRGPPIAPARRAGDRRDRLVLSPDRHRRHGGA